MEETLPFPKMVDIDLLNKLEKISCFIPNRILKVEGFVLKDSLTWLKEFGNKDVDLFRDWLIVSNFQVVSDLVENSLTIDNNALGKIQINKAQGQKCDRCWHYQKETFNGIQNTKLCKRCSNIINLEFT